ncbi:MAG: DNA polymerase III subunit alpha [Gemmatimonadetes bacterium]|uniref:DNA-directed DNA polymerase n=1 Tax=Candidatus Kutchimonas denitrificans TaxID=3056748 RepID=A0AAE4Z9F9_9BACT|nr:DNA polymerase III subunit alpha [Gemmatimonadota bacterium]NIR76103.1 DNA polymerase III subunit alpha [Candidatus Kutchimonas denitrificans]NIS00482.1 DNA polymerase III subunit alpha [Gemmatimonadota bacterium]NIT66140.1 DNA polymerase III subunit alpha [Gemmatimonadota bacterium]NIU54218.1 DNA polymerase III subunit alpha [Gemmatimonadota bacterium]
MSCSSYAELHCHSAFSFLDGAATPEALVRRAVELGIRALALTDHDDLGGIVRFSQAARDLGVGVEAIVGAELTLEPAEAGAPPSHLTVLARTAEGYANLSELVTRSRMLRPRGRPRTSWVELAERGGGLLALTGCPQGELARRVRAGDGKGARELLEFLRGAFGGYLAVEVWDHALPEERELADRLLELADRRGLRAVATNDVHYAWPSGRIVHDVLTCLRHQVTLDEAGTRLRPNGEWYLKPPSAVWRRWRRRPDVVENTLALAAECPFRLAELSPEMPGFRVPAEMTRQEFLERLVWRGAKERYAGISGQRRKGDPIRVDDPVGRVGGPSLHVAPDGRGSETGKGAPNVRSWPPNRALPLAVESSAPGPTANGGPGLTQRVRRQIRHELEVIARLDLAGYFLTVWDVVRFARRHGILLQGRGSAANSCVCYCLGITAVDPIKFELLFERFLSEERGGAPDIDIDIEHERREEVLQYVYRKYGRDRAAMVCETISYRGRSAVRDAARALGFSTDVADRLAGVSDRHEAAEAAAALENGGLVACGLDPADRRVRALVHVVRGLDRLPRHRSIHVGGFVLTAGPLARSAPIEPASMPDRTVIQWDKDDLEFAGLIKIDLLGLGMLTCLAKTIRYVRETRGIAIDLAQLPASDPEVYAMIQAADTVGLFQIESRAQMNSLPRLKPRNFYDLVVQVALIRPGPIQGDMVHPYVRRRRGEEPVTYLHPDLEPILHRTLGVPLFQEQGMKVAVALAGFTPGQADALRRAMGFKRSKEAMALIEPALRDGMTKRGIGPDVQEQVVKQLTAFANYGFPESHSASFALLVYASAYLKRYYAPEFFCGLLNSQPMGFYAPGTLIHDARRHGVEVRPVDLALSSWDCTLETAAPVRPPALRVGLRYVHGMGSKAEERLRSAWEAGGAFTSVEDVVSRSGLGVPALKTLAEAGAFDTLWEGRGRRSALWEVLARCAQQPLAPVEPRERPRLREMERIELVAADYTTTGLCTHGHPMEHLRAPLQRRGVLSAEELARARSGSRVQVAGVVICRQRPGTAKGVCFITLEDETGFSNFIVYANLFQRYRRTIVRSPVLLIEGIVQNEQEVVNVQARHIEAVVPRAGADAIESHDFH